ncbi:MAG: hypothetical protein SOV75_03535 [Candidatus Limiplasma sp.]|nr:hypothetical protein [Candidatus Limiplasma sp.]
MKRFFCLLMCLTCLLLPTAHASGAEAEDYTVAGKLLKQLWAGSGFSATVSVEVAAKDGTQAMSTLKPIVMDLSYIYVRPTATETAEHRADVVLMDGDSALSAAHAQLKDGALAVQADVISPDWYSFGEAPAQDEEAAQSGDLLGKLGESLLAQTGMPALASFAAQAAGLMQGVEGLEDVLESYLIRMDLWIEGYRQNAVLDKLDDGTTTMSVYYDVPPAAIKSQAKQMVLDLLNDQVTLARLQEAAGEELSQLLFNPNLQSYYFSAIDALPLASNLTIGRTVSLEGDTLELHLSLPLYDAEGGEVTLRYDRTRGEGDLPDDNTITLESGLRAISLTYQEYSSITGVRVIQGNLTSEPRGADAFTVGDGTTSDAQKTLALSFSLKQEESETKDDELRDVYTYDATLNLESEGEGDAYVAIPATEVTVSSTFISKELKSAATDMEATVTLGGDGWDQTYTATITGRSRQKWEPEPLSPDRVYVNQMTEADVAALLPGAAVRFAALMNNYLASAPVASASPETSATPETGAAEAAPTDTPETEAAATDTPAPVTEASATETPAPQTAETPAP